MKMNARLDESISAEIFQLTLKGATESLGLLPSCFLKNDRDAFRATDEKTCRLSSLRSGNGRDDDDDDGPV